MNYGSRNNPSGTKRSGRTAKGLFVPGTLYPYATGGMEIFNYYFLRKLLEQDPGSMYYYTDHPLENQQATFIAGRKLKPARFFYPFQFFKLVWSLRNTIDYGMVCFAEQSWILSWSQAFVFRLFRKPYIVVVHWGKLPEWRWMKPMRYFFGHAACVVGVSEFICTEYRKVFPEARLQFIPPLIPCEKLSETPEELRMASGIRPDQRPILFVGSLKGMKNPDVLVDAAILLGKDYLDQHRLCFVLAGQGPMLEELKQTIANAGLEAYFKLPGLISREQVPAYYGMAWTYVIPSDYEGTPLSMLEAMFNGLPIIGSDATGINTILEHGRNGQLFPVRNAEVLAERIRFFAEHPDQAAAMGLKAKETYETNYAFDQLLVAYRKLIAELPRFQHNPETSQLPETTT